MGYRNYYGDMGGIINAIGQAQTGYNSPTEVVIGGVTYRSENGRVYRKQNGQLIPVTDPQELAALERQYVAPPSTLETLMPGYTQYTRNGIDYSHPIGQIPNYAATEQMFGQNQPSAALPVGLIIGGIVVLIALSKM